MHRDPSALALRHEAAAQPTKANLTRSGFDIGVTGAGEREFDRAALRPHPYRRAEIDPAEGAARGGDIDGAATAVYRDGTEPVTTVTGPPIEVMSMRADRVFTATDPLTPRTDVAPESLLESRSVSGGTWTW